MRQGGHIDKRQVAVLVALTIMGTYFLTVPRTMAGYAGSAGWIGPLVGFIPGVIIAGILILLHRRFPTRDFIGISEIVLGKVLGKIWSLAFFIYTLSIFIIIREFSTTILTPFLPESPIGPVLIIMTFLLTYLAYSGIESIARTAQVFLPVIAVSLLFILITSISSGDLGRIQPWLGKGLGGIGMAGLNAGGVIGQLVVFTVILSSLRRVKDDVKALGWGLVLGIIPLTLITMGGISLYGYEGVTRLSFPAISIARTIKIGNYFERLEAIFIIIWFILAMLKIGLIVFASTKTLAGILELKYYQPLVLPTAIFLMLLALQPETDYDALRFIDYFTTYSFPIAFALPGLLLAVAVLRNKRDRVTGQNDAGGQKK